MAEKVKVWFAPEGDFLEVQFKDTHGFMRPTVHEAVMEWVDEQGQVLGFSILGVSRVQKDHPWKLNLSMGNKNGKGLLPPEESSTILLDPLPPSPVRFLAH